MKRKTAAYEIMPVFRPAFWGLCGFLAAYFLMTCLTLTKTEAAEGFGYWKMNLLRDWLFKVKMCIPAGFLFAGIRTKLFEKTHHVKRSSGLFGLAVVVLLYILAVLIMNEYNASVSSLFHNEVLVSVVSAMFMLVFAWCGMMRKMPAGIALLMNLVILAAAVSYYHSQYPVPGASGWGYDVYNALKPWVSPAFWYANVLYESSGLWNTICLISISGVSALWNLTSSFHEK